MGPDGSVIIGAKRSTTNPIINRNHYSLGKSLTSNPSYLDSERVYGTATRTDGESAASIMYNWHPTPEPRKEIDHGRNFLKLNKMAVSAKASGCHEVTEFRNRNDARIVTRPGDVLKLKNQVPVNFNPHRVYGAQTPEARCTMNDLMSYTYEAEWINEQIQKERQRTKKQEQRSALRSTSAASARKYLVRSDKQKSPDEAAKRDKRDGNVTTQELISLPAILQDISHYKR